MTDRSEVRNDSEVQDGYSAATGLDELELMLAARGKSDELEQVRLARKDGEYKNISRPEGLRAKVLELVLNEKLLVGHNVLLMQIFDGEDITEVWEHAKVGTLAPITIGKVAKVENSLSFGDTVYIPRILNIGSMKNSSGETVFILETANGNFKLRVAKRPSK